MSSIESNYQAVKEPLERLMESMEKNKKTNEFIHSIKKTGFKEKRILRFLRRQEIDEQYLIVLEILTHEFDAKDKDRFFKLIEKQKEIEESIDSIEVGENESKGSSAFKKILESILK